MSRTESHPLTILIADDIREVRAFLVALLQREGFTTIEAADGITALEIIRAGQLDLALVDVLLPGLTGLEVLREARRLTRTLPIVLITGLGSVEAAVEAMTLGADGYLTKPMPNQELVQAVRRALRARAGETLSAEPPVRTRPG